MSGATSSSVSVVPVGRCVVIRDRTFVDIATCGADVIWLACASCATDLDDLELLAWSAYVNCWHVTRRSDVDVTARIGASSICFGSALAVMLDSMVASLEGGGVRVVFRLLVIRM